MKVKVKKNIFKSQYSNCYLRRCSKEGRLGWILALAKLKHPLIYQDFLDGKWTDSDFQDMLLGIIVNEDSSYLSSIYEDYKNFSNENMHEVFIDKLYSIALTLLKGY